MCVHTLHKFSIVHPTSVTDACMHMLAKVVPHAQFPHAQFQQITTALIDGQCTSNAAAGPRTSGEGTEEQEQGIMEATPVENR